MRRRTDSWLLAQQAGLYGYAAGAVLFLVYALGFVTQSYVFYAYGDRALSAFYQTMQTVNAALLRESVLCCVFAVVLFLLELNRHAAGLVTLVMTLAVCAATAFFAVQSLVSCIGLKAAYTELDLSALDRYIQRGTISYTPSTTVYTIGIVLSAAFAAVALFIAVTVAKNAFTVKEVQEGGVNAAH
jgi:hypothetical protein